MNNFEIIMLCSVIFFWFMFFTSSILAVVTLYFYCHPISKNWMGSPEKHHKHFNKSFWSLIMCLCVFFFSFILVTVVTS